MKPLLKNSLVLVFLTGLIAGVLPLRADATEPPLEATIDQLLARVTTAKVIFMRNGKDYPGPKAADHMRRKYEHFKKEILTPEDFIRLCGTRSLRSGKVYQVRQKDGRVIPCANWLTDTLKSMRAENGEAAPAPATATRPPAVRE